MAFEDTMRSLREFDVNDLDFENVGSWPTAVKVVIWMLLLYVPFFLWLTPPHGGLGALGALLRTVLLIWAVTLAVNTRLVINARTAAAIGYAPDARTRILAHFLHPEALQSEEEPLTLDQTLQMALDGNITLVGAPEKPLPVSSFALLFGRKSLSGSLIGGIAETQEMLDFCGEHGITADVEVGKIYEGRVARLMDFGAFVTILPGRDGLVHISQISEERVEKVSDKLSEGDIIKVKVLEVDKQGRIRLSMKAVGEDD